MHRANKPKLLTERHPGAGARRGASSEAGTGMVGTMVGATIFLVLLLFAVQFLVRLYATSVVTSAADQAAQAVAGAGGGLSAIPEAESQARQRMGSFGGAHAQFIWREVDPQQVVLEVVDESPSFTPLPASYRQITRTVTVRTERFR